MRITWYASIKFRIVALCAVLCTLFSVVMYYVVALGMQQKKIAEDTQTAGYSLQLIMDEVDRNLFQVFHLVSWCSTNTDIKNFLAGRASSHYTSRPVAVAAYDTLNAKLFNSSIDPYLNRVIIAAAGGAHIQRGNFYGLPGDARFCEALPEFQALMAGGELRWLGILPDRFPASPRGADSIPIARPLDKAGNWIYISLSPDVLLDALQLYYATGDTELFWLLGEQVYTLRDGGFTPFAGSLAVDSTQAGSRQITDVVLTVDGVQRAAVAVRSQNADWTVIQPLHETGSWVTMIPVLTILLPVAAIVAVAAVFMLTLNRSVTAPVVRIYRRINRISQGDFSRDGRIEGASEFGVVGRGINDMAHSIETLLDERMATEAAKRQLELNVLQNQINPHFLYNTLNTIKWMAVMQGAHGIEEMTASLAKILQDISKKTAKFTPLSEELTMIDNYILIQKYRYVDKFTYSCRVEEGLMDSEIMRFLIQPVIENAIFHGIEPKPTPGRIDLTVRSEGPDILVEIFDDGIGIPPERIGELMKSAGGPGAIFKAVGLHNVDQRLRLEYGEGYGVTVTSVPGEYTRVVLRYPRAQDGAGRETEHV